MITLSIKNLKFIKELFPRHEEITHLATKTSGLTIASHWNISLMKLSDLFASFLFNAKVGVNFWKNLVKRIRSKRPDDHGVSAIICWFSVCYSTSKALDQPWENREFSIADLKGNHPGFGSSFPVGNPVLYSKTAFCINQAGKVGEISSGRGVRTLKLFKGVKFVFINSVTHVDLLFNLINELLTYGMAFSGNLFSSARKALIYVLNESNAKRSRFLFKDKKIFNPQKNAKTIFPFNVPKPRWASVDSLFGSFLYRSCKFFFEKWTNIFVNRANLQRRFINPYVLWFLYVDSAVDAAISINITSQICIFHKSIMTDRRINCQYPQRLTGLGSRFLGHVIV